VHTCVSRHKPGEFGNSRLYHCDGFFVFGTDAEFPSVPLGTIGSERSKAARARPGYKFGAGVQGGRLNRVIGLTSFSSR
jgi:hypothetical protein